MKAVIEFEVDMGAGELPYRAYATERMVVGEKFVIISKLLASNEVFMRVFTVSEKGVKMQMEKCVSSIDSFHEAVSILETDLQKVDPTVKLERQEGFMSTSEDVEDLKKSLLPDYEEGDELFDAKLQALINVLEKMKRAATTEEEKKDLLPLIDIVEAAKKVEKDGTGKGFLLAKIEQAKIMDKSELEPLFLSLPVEEKLRFIEIVMEGKPGASQLMAHAQALADFESVVRRMKPSSRLSKYL